MKLIITIVTYILAILLGSYLLPGVQVADTESFIVLAVLLLILRVVVRPILKILTLPINFLTLGLFSLVINLFLIYVAEWLVLGFEIDNLLSGFIFSLILSITIVVLEKTEKVSGIKKK